MLIEFLPPAQLTICPVLFVFIGDSPKTSVRESLADSLDRNNSLKFKAATESIR